MFTNYKTIRNIEKAYNLLIEDIDGDIKKYNNLINNLNKINTIIFKRYKEKVLKNITYTKNIFKR